MACHGSRFPRRRHRVFFLTHKKKTTCKTEPTPVRIQPHRDRPTPLHCPSPLNFVRIASPCL
ncbi:hypothetical protein CGRA01v4_05016 [Colletotrichum graminicola]|nr:hypothetical protein CGRA01v4_05016 [Colletotrichum graminicola]